VGLPVVERRLNIYYVQFLPIAAGQDAVRQHEGGEFIYMLTGTLTVQIAGEEHTLTAGDSIHATTPDGYRRTGATTCAAIVVTSR
jgi:quercetin dioxygenase-like cupin family protein